MVISEKIENKFDTLLQYSKDIFSWLCCFIPL
jgi:hypothetical protein